MSYLGPPSTRIPFCLKTDFFFSSLAYRRHVSGKNGHRKRIFSKTLSRVEIFWKRRLFVYMWTDVNGGFRIRWCYTSKIHHFKYISMTHAQSGMPSYFDRFRVFVWTCENDSNTPRVDAHLFENGKKKSPLSKISGYAWTGISDDYIHYPFEKIWLWRHRPSVRTYDRTDFPGRGK